jgi:hypothetical protein
VGAAASTALAGLTLRRSRDTRRPTDYSNYEALKIQYGELDNYEASRFVP